jgi:hypothetical protein
MRLAWHIAGMGERRDLYSVLAGNNEGNRLLGRPMCRREDNIKMDFQKEACGSMHWIELAHDRDRWREIVNAVINTRVP